MRSNNELVFVAVLLAMTLGLASYGPATAATLELPIVAHASISDDIGQTRLLIDFGDLRNLAGKKILYAKCRINIDVDSCVDVLNELEIKPLTKAWSAETVTWESSWTNTGGDYNDSMTRITAFQGGPDGETEILLTELVQAWIDGRVPSRGLILIPREGGCDYELSELPHDTLHRYGVLKVRFVDDSE
jgi:hypothetical protein